MAESAAHFAFTTQNRPSIFEIVAAKSLNDTLHPAIQKLALFLATNCPEKFHWLGQHYDEVFLILDAILQYGYLRSSDATFSENFYGLKRVLEDDSNLNQYYRGISLLVTALLPYFKRKLDEKVALYRLEQADGYLHANFEGNLKKILIYSHSSFEVIWGLLTVYNYIRYMSGSTQIQLPILQIIGLKLTFADPVEEDSSLWSTLLKGHFQDIWKLNVWSSAVSSIFQTGAFFLQFLEAWKEQKSSLNLTALPTVPPPPLDGRAKNYLNKCPICLQVWKIPTVLPVSGYVFCFPCILRHLRENQKCPITNLPASPLDIIRLYDS